MTTTTTAALRKAAFEILHLNINGQEADRRIDMAYEADAITTREARDIEHHARTH